MTMTYGTSPTADELRQLSVPELGLIFLRGQGAYATLNANSTFRAHEQAHEANGHQDWEQLLQRMSDVWAWLVAQSLIGPHHQQRVSDGWMRVTDRGRRFVEEGSPTTLLAEQRLPEDLHPELQEARRLFLSGNTELSVFEAMRQVEVHLRTTAGAPGSLIGVALARQVLHPETGALTDQRLEKGERQALGDLVAGALGTFKNPTSHRIVNFDDPARAAGAVVLADLLLRTIEASTAS